MAKITQSPHKVVQVHNRRQFLTLLGMSFLTSQIPAAATNNISEQPILKPPRLNIGDTIGLINPASQIEPEDIKFISNFLQQKGFQIKLGKHIFDQYGYLAGKDKNRAADVNAMFADDSVKALLTVRGGWGCNRILSLLNYDLIRQNPKIIMGYSDITSLLLAIYARSRIITFHGPVGISTWNPFSVDYVTQILLEGEAIRLQNPINYPIETITRGKATGHLLGGNLSVLTAIIGSAYLPDWKQSILFVEEIGEDIYRIDRMLTQLKLAGILDQLAGFIFAQCKDCVDLEDSDPSLTLQEILADHIKPLGIPAWYGSMIGHIRDKFTVPIGLKVEIDANQGTIQMLDSAVSI